MWVRAREEHILAFMCLFCLCTGNEQQSGVLRIKHKHTQTRRHTHPLRAGCDMLREMLLFRVMCLASEPSPQAKKRAPVTAWSRRHNFTQMKQLCRLALFRKGLPAPSVLSGSPFLIRCKMQEYGQMALHFWLYIYHLFSTGFFPPAKHSHEWVCMTTYLNCQFGWKIIMVIISSCLKQWGATVLKQRMFCCIQNV